MQRRKLLDMHTYYKTHFQIHMVKTRRLEQDKLTNGLSWYLIVPSVLIYTYLIDNVHYILLQYIFKLSLTISENSKNLRHEIKMACCHLGHNMSSMWCQYNPLSTNINAVLRNLKKTFRAILIHLIFNHFFYFYFFKHFGVLTYYWYFLLFYLV